MNPGDEIDGLRVIEKRGGGSFAVVYEVVNIATNECIAMKVFTNFSDPNYLPRFRSENTILHDLHPHPHVLSPLSRVREPKTDFHYYTMELADHDLDTHINSVLLNFNELIQIFKSICAGLRHAHERDIAHRDLHWKNILIKLNATGIVKISDFGLAKDFNASFQTNQPYPCWGEFVKPPEVSFGLWDQPVLAHQVLGDIYALGIILYSLFNGLPTLNLADIKGNIALYLRRKTVLGGLGDAEREAIYKEWLSSYSATKGCLRIQMVDQTQTDQINALLKHLTNIDYTKRIASVGALEAEMVTMGI